MNSAVIAAKPLAAIARKKSVNGGISSPVTTRDNADEYIIDSTQLLQGRKSITIEHHGVQYRLQNTKLGKLILTK
jgi:hemin uptake protein HemP